MPNLKALHTRAEDIVRRMYVDGIDPYQLNDAELLRFYLCGIKTARLIRAQFPYKGKQPSRFKLANA